MNANPDGGGIPACTDLLSGLFRGIGPRVSWITIGGFIFFGAYEGAQKNLGCKQA